MEEEKFEDWKERIAKVKEWKAEELCRVSNENAKKIIEWQDMEKEAVKAYNEEKGPLDPEVYYCEKCLNRGAVAVFDEAFGQMAIRLCDCLKIREGLKLMEESGCSPLLKKCRLENFEEKDRQSAGMKDRAIKWLSMKSRPWFYVGGGVGTGKTHLTVALSNSLMQEGRAVRIVNWVDELMMMRPGVESERFRIMREAPILMIDDFFRGNPDEFSRRIAYSVINYRYSQRLLTLINSEHDLRGLFLKDEAIASRIKESCCGFAITVYKKNERMNLHD